jgi:hypothetical protein
MKLTLARKVSNAADQVEREGCDGTSQSCNRVQNLARKSLLLLVDELRELYDGEDSQINPEIFAAIDALKF